MLKTKDLAEYEGTTNLESKPKFDDAELTGGDTSATNIDKVMLNTTYAIRPLKGHLKHSISKLSEFLSKIDSTLLCTWASSGSYPVNGKENQGVEPVNAHCEIINLVRENCQNQDSPPGST